METRTRIVLLMHPKELRHQKCTTGRLDDNPRFRSLIDDPGNYPVLLYPEEGAMRLRGESFPGSTGGERRLVVFLIDATWHCSRTIVRKSPSLMRLPRLTIEPAARSRFVIKHQPAAWCLSTIEAAHELLLALEAMNLDVYPARNRLLEEFKAMQDFQLLQTTSAAPGTRPRALREVRSRSEANVR